MGELFSEIAHEIAVDPIKFVVELVQFGVLVGIVWMVGIGSSKRKGMIVNMLDKRRQKVAGRIERAEGAPDELEAAKAAATERLEGARKEAAEILKSARAGAKEDVAGSKKSADESAADIVQRAGEAIETETEEMHVEVRDRLVELVAAATRSILNEGLSPAQQRELIEGAVVDGLDRLEATVGAGAAAGGEVAS